MVVSTFCLFWVVVGGCWMVLAGFGCFWEVACFITNEKYIIQGSVNYLEEHGGGWINWKRNQPTASNMGGVWEWQIRSDRMILSFLMITHGGSLTDESIADLAGWDGSKCQFSSINRDNHDVASLIPQSPITLIL